MSTNEVGTAPHFPEKQSSAQNSFPRKSQNAAQRYANAEENKDQNVDYIFDEADDSDYDRVELLSERKDVPINNTLQQTLSSNIQQIDDTYTTQANFNQVSNELNPKISQAAIQKNLMSSEQVADDDEIDIQEEIPRKIIPEPLSNESSEMYPQEFMNSEIDKVSEMEQFRNSVNSLDQLDRKQMLMASMPNPFRNNDLNPKKQTSGFKFVEKALPLVTFNQKSQQFNVNSDVIQMMEQVKGPLGVISVAGMYRTGKSYLLNRVILNRQRGFGVGPTVNPCTKGIWIWGTPLSGFNPDGEPINIIVIDSEGLGGIDEDNNHDMRIFSLALLISSYFVYNSMGQIDENAISSLSLVVNRTKQIQLNCQKDKETDLDKVLPSFIWVVRDFSLQLEDEEGNEISQSDYLEKALLQQSSDPSDQKTIIRKCLIKYFPKRDCCTLVRPLVDEEKLQKLEELEIDQLRAEFIEQVMDLRRKVLSNCPVKQVYGHSMDGETWVNLLSLYVNAINNGNVPNIESAWVQICRNKAQSALSQVVDQFEREISEVEFPANQPEFEKTLTETERNAVRDLQKELNSEPNLLKEYMLQLKKYLTKRIQDLNNQNLAACQEYSQQMLQQLFTELDQIKNTCQEDPQSNSFQQVEYALRELSNYYETNCFEFPEKQIYLAETKLSFMLELLSIQSHHATNQYRLQQEIETQNKERQSQMMREAKEESRAEQLRLEGQWKLALQLKSELEASSQILHEQLNNLKEVKSKADIEHIEAISKLKKQITEMQEEFQINKDKNEELTKELIRNQKQSASEFEKEKALLGQKVEYLEKSLKEKSDREKEYSQDWRNQKSGLSQEIKTLAFKHESEMKALLQSLDEERDKTSELESKLLEKCQKLEQMEEKSRDIQLTLKSQLTDAQNSIKDLQESKNQIKQQTMNQLSSKLQQSQQDLQQQKQFIDELERKLKESIEHQLQISHESKKQVAMRDQKIEFLDMHLKDLKEQLEETQRQHAHMVKALNQRNENSDDESEATQNKIEQIQKDFSITNEQQLQQIKDLQSEITKLRHDLGSSESQGRKQQNELEIRISDAKQQLEETEQQKLNLIEKIKVLEAFKLKVNEDQKIQEQQYKQRLAKEINEHEEQFKAEIKDQQLRHDEQITQLKNFYEIEKDKVELRITEEKERSQRRLANYQEEQETRLREEFRDKDAEIESLQQQIQELEQHQQSYSTQVEHEISLKQLQLEGLERQNSDLKERLNKLEITRNSAFDKQIEHFEQQRQELNGRIDKLMADNLNKDKSLAQLTHKLERTAEQLDRRNAEFDQAQQLIEREKQTLIEKFEFAKLTLAEVQDESMQNKLESGREIALLNQQVEFLNRKIDDLQRSNEEGQKMFDDKLKVIRQEIYDDSQAQVDRATSEKDLWESKYEQKRKALKDLETSLGKKISDLEKQTSMQQSTIQKLEVDKINKEHALNEEISRLQSQLISNDLMQNQKEINGLVPTEEMLKMKASIQELEREIQDLQSNYDRDKALWEGKVQFLESQKDNYKKDLIESQRKFEQTLEQLQKRGTQNKERQETSQNAIMKVLEAKYKSQIKEMLESQQSQANDYKEKNKKLETELNELNDKLNAQSKSRYDEIGQLEKKLQESKQNEIRLQAEFSDFQVESNIKLDELMQQMQKDKEISKQKLAELDKKAKEAEQKRTQLLFQVEKERANWQLEEDHLRRKQAELNEFIQSLERSKENLKKENGKLRDDVRGNSAVGGAQKKSFVFAKGAQHLLNQTASQMQNSGSQIYGGLPKSNLIMKTGSLSQTDQSVSSTLGGTTQGSSNGISSSSIVNAAINKLKENQEKASLQELNQQTSQSDLKLRQMASPDVTRQAKSPLIINRAGQNNFKPTMPPRQPFTSGSINNYNMNTPSAQHDIMSNNGSTNGLSQGFKLNLQNRYNSQGHTVNPDENK